MSDKETLFGRAGRVWRAISHREKPWRLTDEEKDLGRVFGEAAVLLGDRTVEVALVMARRARRHDEIENVLMWDLRMKIRQIREITASHPERLSVLGKYREGARRGGSIVLEEDGSVLGIPVFERETEVRSGETTRSVRTVIAATRSGAWLFVLDEKMNIVYDDTPISPAGVGMLCDTDMSLEQMKATIQEKVFNEPL